MNFFNKKNTEHYEEYDTRTEEEKTLAAMRCAVIVVIGDLIAIGITAAIIISAILR